MVMQEDHSGVPVCGHRKPPGAHVCDTCGVKLAMECPRCHTINRDDANFCSSCGVGLGDARRMDDAPPIAPFDPSPARASATESESAPASPEPFLPAKQAPNERTDGPGSFDALPLTAESCKGLLADEPEDERRLERMVRSTRRLQERRHTQRAWLVLGTVGVTIVIAFLGVGLFRAYTEPPSAVAPRVIGSDPPGRIATRAHEGESATVAQSSPA